MYFGTKNYLKRTRNHTVKHTLNSYLSKRFFSGKNFELSINS